MARVGNVGLRLPPSYGYFAQTSMWEFSQNPGVSLVPGPKPETLPG